MKLVNISNLTIMKESKIPYDVVNIFNLPQMEESKESYEIVDFLDIQLDDSEDDEDDKYDWKKMGENPNRIVQSGKDRIFAYDSKNRLSDRLRNVLIGFSVEDIIYLLGSNSEFEYEDNALYANPNENGYVSLEHGMILRKDIVQNDKAFWEFANFIVGYNKKIVSYEDMEKYKYYKRCFNIANYLDVKIHMNTKFIKFSPKLLFPDDLRIGVLKLVGKLSRRDTNLFLALINLMWYHLSTTYSRININEYILNTLNSETSQWIRDYAEESRRNSILDFAQDTVNESITFQKLSVMLDEYEEGTKFARLQSYYYTVGVIEAVALLYFHNNEGMSLSEFMTDPEYIQFFSQFWDFKYYTQSKDVLKNVRQEQINFSNNFVDQEPDLDDMECTHFFNLNSGSWNQIGSLKRMRKKYPGSIYRKNIYAFGEPIDLYNYDPRPCRNVNLVNQDDRYELPFEYSSLPQDKKVSIKGISTTSKHVNQIVSTFNRSFDPRSLKLFTQYIAFFGKEYQNYKVNDLESFTKITLRFVDGPILAQMMTSFEKANTNDTNKLLNIFYEIIIQNILQHVGDNVTMYDIKMALFNNSDLVYFASYEPAKKALNLQHNGYGLHLLSGNKVVIKRNNKYLERTITNDNYEPLGNSTNPNTFGLDDIVDIIYSNKSRKREVSRNEIDESLREAPIDVL